MEKEDLVQIAISQRVAFTLPKLWSFTVKKLNEIIMTPIDDSILQKLKITQDARAKYAKLTVDKLKQMLAEKHITFPSGINKGGLIDIINQNETTEIFSLDSDQIAAISHISQSTDKTFVIRAGAGAGKTTTLAHVTKQLLENNPQERILVLAYNVAAEAAFSKKIKLIKVPKITNVNIYDNSKFGVAVCTFDKFGYRINKYDEMTTQTYDEDADNDLNFAEGYRRALERAFVNLTKNSHLLKFTTMIVDEAQDILPQHVQIINEMIGQVKKVIIAGDPLQELYEGASWYRSLLEEHNVINLRYNHRCGPQIVAALNLFIERNFPALYVPQIPVIVDTDDTKKFNIIVADTINCTYIGNICGDLVNSKDRHYILGPITTNKFGLDNIAPAARQIINEKNPTCNVKVAKSGDRIDDIDCVISTSKLVKGTESDHVILFGTDIAYAIKLDKNTVARHFYVALSRGIKTLTLVHRESIEKEAFDMLEPLIELAGGGRRQNIIAANAFTLPSTIVEVSSGDDFTTESGLCTSESIAAGEFASLATGQSIPIDIQGDDDFVGLFAESLIMDKLGILPFRCEDVEIVKHGKRFTHIGYENDRYTIYTKANNEEAIVNLINTIKLLSPKNNAYLYALIRFSIAAGRLWTVSERLEHVEHLEPYIENCTKQLLAVFKKTDPSDLCINFMHHGSHEAQPGRGEEGEASASLEYNINITIEGHPIDLKYVDEITVTHRKKSAICAMIMGAKFALIYNLKTGIIETVAASNKMQVEMTARAIVGLRFARDFRNKLIKYQSEQSLIQTPYAKMPCLISVDIETCGDLIMEIAAVAFTPADYKILGVYHKILPGVAPYVPSKSHSTQETIIGKLTNLMVKDKKILTEIQVSHMTNFKAWIFSLSETAPIIHWGGSEAKDFTHTLDVRNTIFRPWSKTDKLHNTKLIDAAEHICRKYNWIPHRAFDDAVLTCIVLAALAA